jgi:hypothetical protein
MRRLLRFLGWIGVSLTSITLVLTLLTTYQFIYVKYFDSYYTLEWCIFFTMIVWAINMLEFKTNLRSMMYPVMYMVIAVGTMFFMFMKVF